VMPGRLTESAMAEIPEHFEKLPTWLLLEIHYAFLITSNQFLFREDLKMHEKQPYVEHFQRLCEMCSDEWETRDGAV